MPNLISLAGIFVLLLFAWVLSTDRRRVNWRLIGWGLGLQLVFAAIIFQVPAGAAALQLGADAVVQILNCANAGTRFVFGPLALGPGEEGSLGFILATQGLPTVIFFSALMAALYYIGLMPLIIRGFAAAFTRLMRLSGAESLCAASNIFVGVESALTIRPYLQRMTRSELCVVLAAGMATVASTVLGVYIITLQGIFPTIAGHLISASLLSAPAALIMAKLLAPETETPETLGVNVRPHYEKESSLFEAVIHGSMAGVKLLVGIVALLLAVLGLAELADVVLGWIGSPVNAALGWSIDWSLAGLLGYVFHPFALLIGVAPADAAQVARLLGERAILTEIPAYEHLAAAMRDGTFRDPRSAVITAYALCGFAHVASMGIFVGGATALAPERTKELAAVGLRALLAATLACLLTGAVAGVFFRQSALLLP